MRSYRLTNRHTSSLWRLLNNQNIDPQMSQICTDLKNYKEILKYLIQRNLPNLWMINADFPVGRNLLRVSKFGKRYLSCAPLKVKKRKEALILYG